jgi:FixJ family two-component response regulator
MVARRCRNAMTPDPEALIHIVDDDDSMRRALSRVLQAAGYAVKGYATAGDFLVAEADEGPGCMLLDLEMPGPSGLELQRALRRRGSRMPIVFMSAYADVPRTVRAIKDGASDFLVKPIEAQTLLAAVESALAVDAGPQDPAPREPAVDVALGERETVVLRGIVAGRLNKQIGAELALSERTIKTCRAELMRKLGARSLAELVRLAGPLLPG